jgi:hypothetical protein
MYFTGNIHSKNLRLSDRFLPPQKPHALRARDLAVRQQPAAALDAGAAPQIARSWSALIWIRGVVSGWVASRLPRAYRRVFARWKRCRVAPDYHVEIDGHWYSTPYRLIR